MCSCESRQIQDLFAHARGNEWNMNDTYLTTFVLTIGPAQLSKKGSEQLRKQLERWAKDLEDNDKRA